MKANVLLIAITPLLFSIASCNQAPDSKEKQDVTIIYTNDIHGYIDNATKDSGGEEVDAVRFSKVAGYADAMKREGKNVLLVDAGDEVQGSIFGAIDKGKEMIQIMNEAGYDLATPGNHDFDFGMDGFQYFVNHADFPYISCNFLSLPEEKRVLEPYKIFDIGGNKIGFIGISTPETITSSTPKYFENEDGEFIYTFLGYDDPRKLYQSVQNTIDAIEGQTDYIIALAHLGVSVEAQNRGYSSIDVISNTKGLSALIDGHSHTVVEQRMIKTLDQKDCLLTQTGCYLDSFGEMTITKDGTFSTRLIKDTEEVNKEVEKKENALISRVKAEMSEVIATADNELYVNNPDVPNQRIIRARETNLGNLCSDSMYWYINDKKQLNCDLAFVNGGGIRKEINAGDVSYLDVQSVHPFGNQVCLIKTKGINVKNAIEMGVNVIGEWDTDWDCPAENGGFLHIAGMKYEIDASIPSSLKTDSNGMFESIDGPYRVKNLQVYDKETNSYVPFDEDKEYAVGGINYLLKNAGNGLSMFNDSETILDYIDADYVVLAEYMKAFANAHINNDNAPIKTHQNYAYDYENPLGSNRITILGLEEQKN